MSDQPTSLGQLRASGWKSRTIKAELREHAIAKIAANEPLFPGVLGYEDTVLPQLEHAVLAGHDIVFLGERGQAKTRMIRSLTNLLDEWMPIVAGSEINDDPYHPASRMAIDLVAEHGDDTPISWVHRSDRFEAASRLPTRRSPTSLAKSTPSRLPRVHLSDELTLHYGLVPRTNQGIFAINELPDLAERIQVGLLNILEERDVQVRGYKVRLPVDVMLVASANPEDYTNRGRMITPLKDRFGAQIRTHYPLEIETEMRIVEQESSILTDGVDITIRPSWPSW
ncbi:MAG: sigma 54-interacting transcriptional regulator [Acidimicrobiales bacterium]